MEGFIREAAPGWRVHRLSGERRNEWSVSVSANWRITFEERDGAIEHLNLEDYVQVPESASEPAPVVEGMNRNLSRHLPGRPRPVTIVAPAAAAAACYAVVWRPRHGKLRTRTRAG